jgi:3-hydroxyacyl-CoA dehydrogenase/enoyl-CoA hydratase/3-hydroxybutyryl-CoA epimerase
MKVSDFITIEKRGSTAILWIDHQLEKMNIVSPDTIHIFKEVVNQIKADDSVRAAVMISKKKDFIAGADIKSFAIEKEGDFRPTQAEGHGILAGMENSTKPIVAAVHGACVGLGTEIILACHACIASNDPKTFFGLPEVKIGILPGGGGTQRLPRRVGIQKALDMMLTGKSIYAYRAQKMGLVDELTAPGKLLQAALIMAERLQKKPLQRKRKTSLTDKLLEGTSIGRSILFSQAKKMAFKQSQGNYPAIPGIIDCVETSYQKGIKAGYEKELEWFEKLLLTNESAALRSLFFGMTNNKKNPYGKVDKPIQTLGMIGAGFMGAGIAEVSVNKGIEVLLKDIAPDMLNKAYGQIWKSLEKKLKYKAITKTQAEETIGNLHGQLTYENFKQVDIVIEAVLEKMALKKRIIEDVEANCRADVIIATNTSSLSVTEMATHAKHPERVIGMHYFSPVPKMPLLEIVVTEQTAPEIVAACYDLGQKQGKTCIVVKDGPGFYVNRILAPYLNECLLMVDEGISFELVDKALIKKGFPVGPITLLDQVGLDIASHVTDSVRPLVEGREGVVINESVQKMAEAGRLGRKSGKGFYTYNEKGKRQGVDKAAYAFFAGNGDVSVDVELIQDRSLLMMLNEAIRCLEEGIIANIEDGNLGAVFGIGFLPFTGGPFRYMNTVGLPKIVDRMKELAGQYGPKFEPADLLLRYVEEGRGFE